MMTRAVSAMRPLHSCIAHRCTQHPVVRLDAASERTGNLRATIAAMTVMDRYLAETVTCPCCLDQHFDSHHACDLPTIKINCNKQSPWGSSRYPIPRRRRGCFYRNQQKVSRIVAKGQNSVVDSEWKTEHEIEQGW